MSNYPKILLKMNAYFHDFLLYFDNTVHAANGKTEAPKKKVRMPKGSYPLQVTPDGFNLRATVHKPDSVRRNPAP